MTAEEKIALVAEALDVNPASLSIDSSLDDTGMWDSTARMTLVALLDKHFGKSLAAKDTANFKSVGDVLRFMDKP
jgi:acyl carrier protein